MFVASQLLSPTTQPPFNIAPSRQLPQLTVPILGAVIVTMLQTGYYPGANTTHTLQPLATTRPSIASPFTQQLHNITAGPRILSSMETQALERYPYFRKYLRDLVSHVRQCTAPEISEYSLYAFSKFGPSYREQHWMHIRAIGDFENLSPETLASWTRVKVDIERDFDLLWMAHHSGRQDLKNGLGESLQFKRLATLYETHT